MKRREQDFKNYKRKAHALRHEVDKIERNYKTNVRNSLERVERNVNSIVRDIKVEGRKYAADNIIRDIKTAGRKYNLNSIIRDIEAEGRKYQALQGDAATQNIEVIDMDGTKSYSLTDMIMMFSFIVLAGAAVSAAAKKLRGEKNEFTRVEYDNESLPASTSNKKSVKGILENLLS